MSDNTFLKTMGVVLGLFVISGVGLGLTGYIGIEFIAQTMSQDGGENVFAEMLVVFIFLQSAIVTLFAGPLVASSAGIIAGYSLRHRGYSLMVSGAGSFLGFLGMVFIAILLMTLALPETGGGGGGSGGSGGSAATDLGQLATPMLKSSIPTTVAGLVAGLLGTLVPRE